MFPAPSNIAMDGNEIIAWLPRGWANVSMRSTFDFRVQALKILTLDDTRFERNDRLPSEPVDVRHAVPP